MALFDKDDLKLKTPEDLEKAEQKLQDDIKDITSYKTIGTAEKGIEMKPEFWGCLWPYIQDNNITDIDYNGRELWNMDINGIHTKVDSSQITPTFMDILVQRIANEVSKPFNNTNPILEAETKDLRISVLHESVASTGRSLCVRKTPEFVRISTESALKDGYATKKELAFLMNCIKANMNIAVCGEPGVGKTELSKYLSSFIPDNERVITIEDTLEWHYSSIHPHADSVALKISDKFTYFDAIKSCLRQNPKWLMLSESRGEEVIAYIQQLSTGTHGITTLHCDSAKKIPERLVNMAANSTNRDRMEYDIYNFLSIGVLVNKKPEAGGKEKRFIDQICVYGWEGGEKVNKFVFNNMLPTVDDISTLLPIDVARSFEKAGIKDILDNPNIHC